jgi:hypothetical protein
VFLSILFGVVSDRIAAAFASVRTDPAFLDALRANPEFAASLENGGGAGLDLNDTSFLNHLDPALQRPVLEGFASSIDTVFTVGGIVILVAFALIWFLKEVPLSSKSGIQRAAEERGKAAESAPAAVS